MWVKAGVLEAGLPGLGACLSTCCCVAAGTLPDLSVPQRSLLQREVVTVPPSKAVVKIQ